PAVQRKINAAGTVSRSFAEGRELLPELADLPVSAKRVERVTRRIGEERVAERDDAALLAQAPQRSRNLLFHPAVPRLLVQGLERLPAGAGADLLQHLQRPYHLEALGRRGRLGDVLQQVLDASFHFQAGPPRQGFL